MIRFDSAPVVLDEVLLEMRAVPDLVLLQVDRELLDLAEEKAGERRSGVGDAREIGEQAAEGERAGGRGRLDDVQRAPTAGPRPSSACAGP